MEQGTKESDFGRRLTAPPSCCGQQQPVLLSLSSEPQWRRGSVSGAPGWGCEGAVTLPSRAAQRRGVDHGRDRVGRCRDNRRTDRGRSDASTSASFPTSSACRSRNCPSARRPTIRIGSQGVMAYRGNIAPFDALWNCDQDGCADGLPTGRSPCRGSPKGEPSVGLCSEHHTRPLEKAGQLIKGVRSGEDCRNGGRGWARWSMPVIGSRSRSGSWRRTTSRRSSG